MISFTTLIPRSRAAWTLFVGGLIVCAVAAGVALGPIKSAFSELDESIAHQEERLARNLRMIAPASKDEVQRAYAEFGSSIAKQGSTAEGRATMLAEIERVASQTGVVLSSTKPREPRIAKDFEEHQAGIEIEGKMSQLVGFLYGVESSPQLLRVERLILDVKADGESGILRGNLLVSKVVTL